MDIADITPGRAVSIEVECYGTVPRSQHYKVARDGSLSAGGIEIKYTTERGVNPISIPSLSAVKNCTVDRTCGLHVHVDLRDLDRVQAAAVYERLVKVQRVLKLLVPVSRHRNRYCRWASNLNRDTRYAAINFRSYYKYQTIEFRCQSGSVDRDKIEKWAELCYQMVQWARTAPERKNPITWKGFLDLLRPQLRNWCILRRVKLHEPQHIPLITQALAGTVTRYAKADLDVLRSLGFDQSVVQVPRTVSRTTWNGHSPVSLARWFGNQRFSIDTAEQVFSRLGLVVSRNTIAMNVRAGRRGVAGAMLTKVEVRELCLEAMTVEV